MTRGSAREGLASVQAQIEKEKAEALGRAGERLEGSLRALRLIRDEVEALEAGRATPADLVAPGEAARRRRADYAALRRQARQFHHFLIIQREVMGFRRHGDVDRLYPLPDPLGGSGGERREAP